MGLLAEWAILLRHRLGEALKIVPVIKSRDLERSMRFYTKVLDFERKSSDNEDREKATGVAHLIRDEAELLLSRAGV
jgi:hypothetical protein